MWFLSGAFRCKYRCGGPAGFVRQSHHAQLPTLWDHGLEKYLHRVSSYIQLCDISDYPRDETSKEWKCICEPPTQVDTTTTISLNTFKNSWYYWNDSTTVLVGVPLLKHSSFLNFCMLITLMVKKKNPPPAFKAHFMVFLLHISPPTQLQWGPFLFIKWFYFNPLIAGKVQIRSKNIKNSSTDLQWIPQTTESSNKQVQMKRSGPNLNFTYRKCLLPWTTVKIK